MAPRIVVAIAFLTLAAGLALWWVSGALRRLGLAPPRHSALLRRIGALSTLVSAPVLVVAVVAASVP